MQSLSLGNQNNIQSFIDSYEYRAYVNDPIGDDYTNISNDDFNEFFMKDYYNFRRLHYAGLVNTRSTSTDSSYKQLSPVDKLEIPTQCNPDHSRSDIMASFAMDTRKILSVSTETFFLSLPRSSLSTTTEG